MSGMFSLFSPGKEKLIVQEFSLRLFSTKSDLKWFSITQNSRQHSFEKLFPEEEKHFSSIYLHISITTTNIFSPFLHKLFPHFSTRRMANKSEKRNFTKQFFSCFSRLLTIKWKKKYFRSVILLFSLKTFHLIVKKGVAPGEYKKVWAFPGFVELFQEENWKLLGDSGGNKINGQLEINIWKILLRQRYRKISFRNKVSLMYNKFVPWPQEVNKIINWQYLNFYTCIVALRIFLLFLLQFYISYQRLKKY